MLVLCGLPVKRPPFGQLLHERRNGQFLLQVAGHPSYGLPWGQDRIVPLFLATLQHIFGATICFGTDLQRERAAVLHHARFSFLSKARIWYLRDPTQSRLPGYLNEVVLSDEFFREVTAHPIPTDGGGEGLVVCPSGA